eukprot:1341697-Amorphochlora_amoeboformis.AAC.2
MEEEAWKKQPKHFSKCRISALAAMKMLKHTLAGVKKGRARDGGKGLPLEVMGLMLGVIKPNSVIVLDSLPLPCDGFESEWDVKISDRATMLMLDVQNRMEEKGSTERVIGWYHSHPFEVGVYNNCFLSAIDLSTQSNYQKAGPAGWTGVVVDPMRCVAKSKLEMSAFRAYPDGFTVGKDVAPDGESIRETPGKNWGTYPEKYYQLETSFFMSSIARSTMDLFSKDSLWIRIIANSKMDDEEYSGKIIKRMTKASTKLTTANSFPEKVKDTPKSDTSQSETAKIAHDLCKEHTLGILRNILFLGCQCRPKRRQTEREDKQMDVCESVDTKV